MDACKKRLLARMEKRNGNALSQCLCEISSIETDYKIDRVRAGEQVVVRGDLQLEVSARRICWCQNCQPRFVCCVGFDLTKHVVGRSESYRILVH